MPCRPPTLDSSIVAYDSKDPPRTLCVVLVFVHTQGRRGAEWRFGFAKGRHRIQDPISDVVAFSLNRDRQDNGARREETENANSRIN